MSEKPKLIRAIIFSLRSTFLLSLQTVVLFLSAGSLAWSWGWIYVAVVYLSALLSMLIVGLTNEQLAKAELEFPEEQQSWDKAFLRLTLPVMVAIFVVAGLDHRWGWSGEVALTWRMAGIVGLLCITRPLSTWAMSVNRYWSGAVYVQHSKGHQVCDVGPYAFVRHPAYLAGIFQWIWPPLVLGSWWALIPAVLVSTVVLIRTYLEDEFLQAELPGYLAYTKRVKYRLFPRVW